QYAAKLCTTKPPPNASSAKRPARRYTTAGILRCALTVSAKDGTSADAETRLKRIPRRTPMQEYKTITARLPALPAISPAASAPGDTPGARPAGSRRERARQGVPRKHVGPVAGCHDMGQCCLLDRQKRADFVSARADHSDRGGNQQPHEAVARGKHHTSRSHQ